MQQHTLGHLHCPVCEAVETLAKSSHDLAHLPFSEASAEWLRNRRGISAGTRRGYGEYLLHLNIFFGTMRLKDIHIWNVVCYQRERQQEIRGSRRHRARLDVDMAPPQESDGGSRINHEISCLGQVLAHAGLWAEIAHFYEPLPLPQSIGLALSAEEEEYLFAVARSRPRWLVAYCCGLLSRNTTAGPGEIRHLRRRDIELDSPRGSFIHIEEGVKNLFRKRPLPLNLDARWAVQQLLDRASALGANDPQHYLLPHRANRQGLPTDPDRPMGSWKKAHYAMCREAAKQFPRLARLRLYDYRHTAATDLLEDPAVSYTTIEHMMGHRISSHTKRKYDHLRNEALRVAADALNRGHCRPVGTPEGVPLASRCYNGPERRHPQSERRGQAWNRRLS